MEQDNKTLVGFFIILFIGLSLISTVNAAELRTSENNVEINDDGTATWTVIMNYSEQIEKSDYFIFARIYDVEVYSIDDKKIECEFATRDVGSLIICDDISSQLNISIIKYTFKSNNQISSFNEFRIFRHGLSITDNLEHFSIIVKLPLGSTLVDKIKIKGTSLAQFEPAYGQEGSDGQKILISWELNRPRLGEPINMYVLYENLPIGLELWLVISIIIIVIILSFLASYYLKKMRVDIKSVLGILSEGERKVMEIVIRNKKVDQRVVVRETDFSKAKVSRIIQSLTSRGIIDAVPKGRTKLITLKSPQKNIFESFSGLRTRYKVGSMKLSKEQAIELVQFITNIIDDLNIKSKNIESKDYTAIKQIKIPQKLEILYEDVKKLYPYMDERLQEYNDLSEKIIKTITKTKQIIKKKSGKLIVDMLNENGLNAEISDRFIEYIINNKAKIDGEYSDFWNHNNKKILKIRESRVMKPLIEDIAKNVENLERMIWDLKEECNNLREEVRKSYNILVKEFYKS